MAGEMAMTGGWTMSMAWMRMPGQSWTQATAMFLAMWLAMMVAMMLPSALPMLLRHRRPAWVGVGYFALWTALGIPVYLVGIVVSGGAMASVAVSRAVPVLGGLTLVLAGLLQFTSWKAGGLDRCRCPPQCPEPGGDGAWPSVVTGLRCGSNCASACSGWMLILLVLGIMNLAAMAIVASFIAVEKLAPRPLWWIRLSGSAAIMGGVATLLR